MEILGQTIKHGQESLSHQLAVREADRPGPGQYSLPQGLAGIARRTVLGPDLVAIFDNERLGELPASQP